MDLYSRCGDAPRPGFPWPRSRATSGCGT